MVWSSQDSRFSIHLELINAASKSAVSLTLSDSFLSNVSCHIVIENHQKHRLEQFCAPIVLTLHHINMFLKRVLLSKAGSNECL